MAVSRRGRDGPAEATRNLQEGMLRSGRSLVVCGAGEAVEDEVDADVELEPASLGANAPEPGVVAEATVGRGRFWP